MSQSGYVLVLLWEIPEDIKFYRVPLAAHPLLIQRLREASQRKATVNGVEVQKRDSDLILSAFYENEGQSALLEPYRLKDDWHVSDPSDEVMMVGFFL